MKMHKIIIVMMIVGGMLMAASAGNAQQPSKMSFDPLNITCREFVQDLGSENGRNAGLAMMWVHAYVSGALGYDKVGPLTQKLFNKFAAFIIFYAEDHPEESVANAATAYVIIQ